MELLFAAMIPGWKFSPLSTLPLPPTTHRKLALLLVICHVMALFGHGIPLHLMSAAKRERVVSEWMRHRWRFLAHGLVQVRSVALLCASRRRR